jgi:hypothetical protein
LVIQPSAIVSTIVILGFEIIWCTILNLGYAYRNSIQSLMNGEKMIQKFYIPMFMGISPKFKKYAFLSLFIIPILMFYFCGSQVDSIFILSIIGMIGFYGSIDHFLIPYMNLHIKENDVENHERVVYLGLLRTDILLLKKNIVILVVSAIILLSILVSSLQQPMEVMLALVSFVVINVLLSLAVMFKFSTEIVGRKKVFSSLERLGYMKNIQKRIIKKEVAGLYIFMIIMSLLYIMNIFIVLLIHQLLDIQFIIFMLIAFIIPLMMCGIVSYIYYSHMIESEE